ncbi:MAG: hypothetical protein H6620_06050 [Halobacteriovoraceae bacterium]|nr:hypothetical protein [Halobacteriovoraceae bacterium]
MTKPIYTITRHNHLTHLVRVLPFIAFAYFFQCFLLKSLSQGHPVGNLCVLMGGILVFLIYGMYLYDIHHKVNIYHNCLVTEFALFFDKRIYSFTEVKDIQVADLEMEFSNIRIIFQNNSHLTLYFVDNPKDVLNAIMAQMIEFKKSA